MSGVDWNPDAIIVIHALPWFAVAFQDEARPAISVRSQCGLTPEGRSGVYTVWAIVAKTLTVVLSTSRTDGQIWKGDLSTGEGEVVISNGQAAGLDYDRRSGYLFVAGAFGGERTKC